MKESTPKKFLYKYHFFDLVILFVFGEKKTQSDTSR